MGDHSAIEWTDATWNPTVGCDKVSAGCQRCYAITQAYRLEHGFKQPAYQGLTRKLPDGSLNWTGVVRTLPERLELPLRWKKPARIFVDSMSDLFHEDVPDEFIEQVFGVMALADWHVFQILTKRPERMAELVPKVYDRIWGYVEHVPLPNVWLGVSIELDRFTWRANYLRQAPAVVRFISAEPLLGPLPSLDLAGIDWLITGGESGIGCRPLEPDWVRSLRDQCQAAHVAYFFKQWGGRTHTAGGRLLDGREWSEFPEPAREAASASW